MPEPLTPEEEGQIRARLEAADGAALSLPIVTTGVIGHEWREPDAINPPLPVSLDQPTAEFVRNSKQDISRLLESLTVLREENEKLKRDIKEAELDARDAASEARWQAVQGEDYGSY